MEGIESLKIGDIVEDDKFGVWVIKKIVGFKIKCVHIDMHNHQIFDSWDLALH